MPSTKLQSDGPGHVLKTAGLMIGVVMPTRGLDMLVVWPTFENKMPLGGDIARIGVVSNFIGGKSVSSVLDFDAAAQLVNGAVSFLVNGTDRYRKSRPVRLRGSGFLGYVCGQQLAGY